MATGDLDGNLDRLRAEVRRTKYAEHLDLAGLRLGDPVAFLPLLQHTLLHFSRHVSQDLIAHGLELRGKTDVRFVEIAFKIMREHYGLKPVLTPSQFLDKGFAERKVMLVRDLICHCVKQHNEAVRLHRVASVPLYKGVEEPGQHQAQDIVCNGTQAQRQPRLQPGAMRNYFSPRDNPLVVLATHRGNDSAAAVQLTQRSGNSEAACDHERGHARRTNPAQEADPNPEGGKDAAILDADSVHKGDTANGRQENPLSAEDLADRFAQWPKSSSTASTIRSQPSGNPFASEHHPVDTQAAALSELPARTSAGSGGLGGMVDVAQRRASVADFGGVAPQTPTAILRSISSMRDPVGTGHEGVGEAAGQLPLDEQLQGLLQGLEQQGFGAEAVQEIAQAVQQIQVKHTKQGQQKGGGPDSLLLQRIEELETRQAAAEAEVASVKREALQTQQQLHARVVVLEGRLRNFEGAAYGRPPALLPSSQRIPAGPHTLPPGSHWSAHSQPVFVPSQPIFHNQAGLARQRLELDNAQWHFQPGKENATVGRDIVNAHNFKVPEANAQHEEEAARRGPEGMERLVQEVSARYEEAQSFLQGDAGGR